MELLNSKSLLAKLMATENLTVEQRDVPTAFFDTKSRLLVIPKLDNNISDILYDLFLGHEVGHALYTPTEGWMQIKEMGLSRSVVNVVEDARIERKIKNKYPGIRNSFVRAYRELMEKNFFETKGLDLNDLNFIDRANLFFKGGPSQGINFTEFEKTLITDIDTTVTYEDVIAVSKKVMEYLKEENEERKKSRDESGESDDEEYGENEDDDLADDDSYGSLTSNFGDLGDEDGEEADDAGDEYESDTDTDTEDDEIPSSETKAGGHHSTSDEVISHTDEALEKNQSRLYSSEDSNYVYANIPDIDTDKVIVPHKVLWNRFRNFDSDIGDPKAFQKHRKDSLKVVSYLVKEFELRKNAEQMKRASISKTGELNMDKVYSYSFNEDIFKKITVTPGGKSHGLVMFIDWSGSMHRHLHNTVKQLLNLIMFCKKVNIPYEVYGFSTEYDEYYCPKPVVGDIAMHHHRLLNFFSSKMTLAEHNFAATSMLYISKFPRYAPTWLRMAGTPLNETIICAMKIVPEFQKKNKLQIVNTVFLTDGEGHSLNSVYEEFTRSYEDENGIINSRVAITPSKSVRPKDKFVIRHPNSKHEEIVRGEEVYRRALTSAYLQMLKNITKTNILGFYVLSSREIRSQIDTFFGAAVNVDKLTAEFRKTKALTVTSAGYDEYYLLRSEGLDTDEDVEFDVKENATTRGLVTAFSKYANNRVTNRVVLNRFIGMIA